MARALARGWGEPVLVADVDAERARALAAEVGGEALPSNAAVAERADLLVLCHKPPQLEAVAAGIDGRATAIASILGGMTLEDLHAAYPGVPVFRFIPNVAVEVRPGALGYAEQELDERPRRWSRRCSSCSAAWAGWSPLPESLIDVAMGLMSTSPADVRGDRRGAHRRRHPPRHAARRRRPRSWPTRWPARPRCSRPAATTRSPCAAR